MTESEIDKLIIDNMKLAHAIAWKYAPKYAYSVEFEDIDSICTLGLVIAAQTFDINKGYNFSTYAYTVIKNELNRQLRKVRNFANSKISIISLDANITPDNNLNLLEILTDDKEFESTMLNQIITEQLSTYIDELPEKLRYVVALYISGLTQKEIGLKIHKSQEEVSRLLRKAFNLLRNKLNPKSM